MDVLNWIQPQVLFLRLHDIRERGYREKVVTDEEDRFQRFQRLYESADRLARVVLTPEREIAQLWQNASDPLNGWRRLRRFTPRIDRVTLSVDGQVYDRTIDREVAHFVHDLIRDWKRPDSTIMRATKAESEVWRDPAARIDPDAKLIGPVWVGAGRSVPAGSTVIGPAVVWDDPKPAPASEGASVAHDRAEDAARGGERPATAGGVSNRQAHLRHGLRVLRAALHAAAIPVHHAGDLAGRRPAVLLQPPARNHRRARVPLHQVPLHAQGCRADQSSSSRS